VVPCCEHGAELQASDPAAGIAFCKLEIGIIVFRSKQNKRLCQSTLQNNLFHILHQPNSTMALTWQAKGNFAVQLRSVISACHMLVAIFR